MTMTTETLNRAAPELQAALDAYVTALHAFSIESPHMTVRELSDYLAARGWPERAMDALFLARGTRAG